MSSTSHPAIEDAQHVTRLFGRWPTFHDSEVLEFTLTRSPVATAVLRLYAFTTTAETQESGFYKRVNECEVTMQFVNIDGLHIDGFNEQNVLAEILITTNSAGFEVLLAGLYGLHASFKCDRIRVTQVIPKCE